MKCELRGYAPCTSIEAYKHFRLLYLFWKLMTFAPFKGTFLSSLFLCMCNFFIFLYFIFSIFAWSSIFADVQRYHYSCAAATYLLPVDRYSPFQTLNVKFFPRIFMTASCRKSVLWCDWFLKCNTAEYLGLYVIYSTFVKEKCIPIQNQNCYGTTANLFS